MYKKYFQQLVISTLFVALLVVPALSPAYGAIKWSQPPKLNPQSPVPECFWGWDEISIYGDSGGLWFSIWQCVTQCHGDANCDGVVNVIDVSILNAAFGGIHPFPPYNPAADFDRDGDVDPDDLLILQNWFGVDPIPRDCPTSPPLTHHIVADDWRCKDDRPVTDIHWWGSYEDYTDDIPPLGPDR
ncbi:MAG: hypothetical protein KAS23_03255, partial [Anaerohalosphaera sp.]|nr:hypothetical protein [Anaerohalosphaera sp.]